MHYLTFEASDGAEGETTLEAVASTRLEQHAAVMAEAQYVLDWARRSFADTQGPVDEGFDWDHDLHVQVEDGQWHTVALTIVGSARFAEAFMKVFGDSS